MRDPDLQIEQAGDATRAAILDAAVRCIARQGWPGANMSLVSRETRMTRGKIQYYFPVIEDLRLAAVEHVYESWRRRYFDRMRIAAQGRDSIAVGIDYLWQLTRETEHRAMAEIEAAARTDPALHAVLTRLQQADEEQLHKETIAAFPELASLTDGTDQLKVARHFTSIFINGLAAHNFVDEAERWQAELLAMLKECLGLFWARRGLGGPRPTGLHAADAKPIDSTGERHEEAAELLRRAAHLLSG
ncbi:TetR/AcrR family transcriptional regulator [Novosphingobium sp. Gsoil 351]|uniref:TetR/AcrR family transcriptional regulator n=1 Tax=Novosphingobium sp. Gsoil 351 TaxID=2675225 RepID=UPI0018A843F3|nr:TetR family transcriptional regulator [Novosphingobium sp. Gsoil 351]